MYDTLISNDRKVQYHAPWIPEGLSPETWYTKAELQQRGMIFLKDDQPSTQRSKFRLTTYARAQVESGAWQETPRSPAGLPHD